MLKLAEAMHFVVSVVPKSEMSMAPAKRQTRLTMSQLLTSEARNNSMSHPCSEQMMKNRQG